MFPVIIKVNLEIQNDKYYETTVSTTSAVTQLFSAFYIIILNILVKIPNILELF